MNSATLNSKNTGLYTMKTSALKLDLTVNQFNYLTTRMNVKPVMRTGEKHSTVLYSDEQIKRLKLGKKLLSLKLPLEIMFDVINLAEKTNYEKTMWLLTFEDIVEKPVICFDEDLLTTTARLKDSNTAISIRKVHIPD